MYSGDVEIIAITEILIEYLSEHFVFVSRLPPPYPVHSLTYGAEPFLRSRQLCSILWNP
jgi:hypothetical protein